MHDVCSKFASCLPYCVNGVLDEFWQYSVFGLLLNGRFVLKLGLSDSARQIELKLILIWSTNFRKYWSQVLLVNPFFSMVVVGNRRLCVHLHCIQLLFSFTSLIITVMPNCVTSFRKHNQWVTIDFKPPFCDVIFFINSFQLIIKDWFTGDSIVQ